MATIVGPLELLGQTRYSHCISHPLGHPPSVSLSSANVVFIEGLEAQARGKQDTFVCPSLILTSEGFQAFHPYFTLLASHPCRSCSFGNVFVYRFLSVISISLPAYGGCPSMFRLASQNLAEISSINALHFRHRSFSQRQHITARSDSTLAYVTNSVGLGASRAGDRLGVIENFVKHIAFDSYLIVYTCTLALGHRRTIL